MDQFRTFFLNICLGDLIDIRWNRRFLGWTAEVEDSVIATMVVTWCEPIGPLYQWPYVRNTLKFSNRWLRRINSRRKKWKRRRKRRGRRRRSRRKRRRRRKKRRKKSFLCEQKWSIYVHPPTLVGWKRHEALQSKCMESRVLSTACWRLQALMKQYYKQCIVLHYCCLFVKVLLRYCLQSLTCSGVTKYGLHTFTLRHLVPFSINERGWMSTAT